MNNSMKVIAIAQLVALITASYLLGDTLAQQIGIACALYVIMPNMKAVS